MKKVSGFTIVELMIAMVIIAILAAVGFPAYNDYVIRGKIADGISTLADGRVKMEQWFQDNRTYAGGPAPAATTYFTYAISNDTTTTYTLTATSKPNVSSAGTFTYTLDQSNARQTTTAPPGWATATMPGVPQTCWITRKGGVC